MKNENCRKNEGCTILIPTYNRPDYLKRILDYYNKYGKNFNIKVADSSSEKNKKINEKNISTNLEITVSHIKYPSEINPQSKIVDTLDYVIDKYCVLCADDDFITPSGIKMSVEFLEKNSDFKCAHGNYIGYCVKDDKSGEKQFNWRPIYPYESIISPDPETRLLSHFANYSPTFYAVHKTDFLKMIFKENMLYTDDYRFGEMLSTMLTPIYGKMKRLNVLYNARETNPYSTGGTSRTLNDFIAEGSYKDKYEKFRGCLAGHLQGNSQLSMEKAKDVVDSGMMEYMKNFNKSSLSRNVGLTFEKMLIPHSLKDAVRKIYWKMFPQNYLGSWIVAPPPDKFLDEYNKIRSSVLHSYLV